MYSDVYYRLTLFHIISLHNNICLQAFDSVYTWLHFTILNVILTICELVDDLKIKTVDFASVFAFSLAFT